MRKKFAVTILACALAMLTFLSAFSTVQAATPSASALGRAVKKAYGSGYTPNVKLTKDEVKDLTGVASKYYSSIYAEVATISSKADTAIIIKCKDEESTSKVLGLMKDYQKTVINQTSRSRYTEIKLQASKLYTTGNYVCFFILGELDSAKKKDASGSDLLKAYKAQNDIAVKAVKNALSD